MASDQSDIRALEEALAAIGADARRLLEGLTAERGVWRAEPDSWSVAQCLDHLATSNRVYLRAMEPAAEDAICGRPGTCAGPRSGRAVSIRRDLHESR